MRQMHMRRVSTVASAPVTVGACNGYRELCDRRLNEVVFAGTHNSMGAADIPDWMFANQERGQVPNIIAVDFYRTGDLLDVAATLNGLASN
jgi:hypothetical protein